MSFLRNESEYIASRITNKGREKISQGNFNIEYFHLLFIHLFHLQAQANRISTPKSQNLNNTESSVINQIIID